MSTKRFKLDMAQFQHRMTHEREHGRTCYELLRFTVLDMPECDDACFAEVKFRKSAGLWFSDAEHDCAVTLIEAGARDDAAITNAA